MAQEVQSCTKLMLSQLISQLRMPAQLPHCLKVVGYLRRMGVFSDTEIRLKFLQARDAWFKSTLEEIPKDNGNLSSKFVIGNWVQTGDSFSSISASNENSGA